MIGLKGRLNVIDNSGALIAECINVLKVKSKKKSTGFGTVGDEIVCVINRARPITQTSNPGGASNVQKVRRGDVRRAVIVRTKQPIMRADGRVVRGVHVRPMTYANGKVWHETLSVEIEDGRETAVSVAHMSTADTVLRCFSLSALWDARRQNPPAPSPSLSPLQVSLPLTPTSFDDNACVLLNNKGEMMGTRVSGVVSAALRDSVGGTDANGRWSKILSLAPKVV
ncbi:uncharacterized protein EHS24_004021 [Apiotrichum porosum]|uniref:Uncharacterized protein n=1 Tax=Apiotrichum porosum TaxID=105984 RepID=A0A427Y427_9TREE|nr:uncharacterized protein EHS24_004021 [Apiotrichum porosum]RSH85841.1 hypothetical protein EHS24_004021 [Apiotrichum porosum]